MRRLALLMLFVTLPVFAIDNLPAFQGGVKPDAIWKMPASVKTACNQATSPDGYINCVLTAMQKAQASAQATAMLQLSRGTISEYKTYNNLAVVRVAVPAADHSENYYIINNDGDVINIDEPAITSSIDITKANNYSALAQHYPNISLWFGNHTYPESITLPGGIQQLQFTYSLLNGCNACELAGVAKVAFNFDSDGHFIGTQLLELDSPPVANTE